MQPIKRSVFFIVFSQWFAGFKFTDSVRLERALVYFREGLPVIRSNRIVRLIRTETCMGISLWSSVPSPPRVWFVCTCQPSIPTVACASRLFATPRLPRRPSSGKLHEAIPPRALCRPRECRRIPDKASRPRKESSWQHKRRDGQRRHSTNCPCCEKRLDV